MMAWLGRGFSVLLLLALVLWGRVSTQVGPQTAAPALGPSPGTREPADTGQLGDQWAWGLPA